MVEMIQETTEWVCSGVARVGVRCYVLGDVSVVAVFDVRTGNILLLRRRALTKLPPPVGAVEPDDLV